MKFTIGTISKSIDFSEDLDLIKSSLLYADEIELIGMLEYLLFKYLPSRLESINDIESLIDSLMPFCKVVDSHSSKELVKQLEELKDQITLYKPYLNKKKRRTTQEIIFQNKVEQLVSKSREDISSKVKLFTDSTTANEISKLIKKEIITVFDYGNEELDLEFLAGGYFANILNAIQSNTSYPLFDSSCNKVISSFSRSNFLDLGNVNHEVLVHAGVATNILMTLPTLKSASIDEIIDFKKEMDAPLKLFRKAIYEFSEEVKTRPWDKDFQYDCLKIYSKNVAPIVEELNELSSDTSVLKNMGKKVLDDEEIRKKAAWTTGGLVTTITTTSNVMGAFNEMKNWLLGLSLVVVAPSVMSGFLKTLSIREESKKEVKEVERRMKGNTMYYYYRASKKLK